MVSVLRGGEVLCGMLRAFSLSEGKEALSWSVLTGAVNDKDGGVVFETQQQ